MSLRRFSSAWSTWLTLTRLQHREEIGARVARREKLVRDALLAVLGDASTTMRHVEGRGAPTDQSYGALEYISYSYTILHKRSYHRSTTDKQIRFQLDDDINLGRSRQYALTLN